MFISQFNLQRYENIGDAQKIKRFFVVGIHARHIGQTAVGVILIPRVFPVAAAEPVKFGKRQRVHPDLVAAAAKLRHHVGRKKF